MKKCIFKPFFPRISHATEKYNKIQQNPINANLLIGFQDQVAEKPYFKPFSECI